MKSQFQQFQQQQQQQRQRMAQGKAWMDQQKLQQKMAAQSRTTSQSAVDQRFSQVEQEAARLRQKFAAGNLTQEALVDKLSELMVQDTSGTWWMVGTESGRWYRFDGKNWVPGTPPGRGLAGITASSGVAASPTSGGSFTKAVGTFILGLALSFGLFMFCGWASYNIIQTIDYDLASSASYVIAVVGGLVGLIITVRKAKQAARGY